jgi:hypothetical protein
MKKMGIKTWLIGGFITATLAFTTSCEKDGMNSENAQYASVLDVLTDGTSTVINANMQSAFIETPGITDSEINSLVRMNAEEKLARDVYAALYEKWGSTVFSRISTAENNHLNAIIRLLQYYGSADTLTGEPGIFADAEVQTLYNNLVANGSVSIEEAYKTGTLIEEMDIKDLSNALAEISNANIIMVFENLERGSRNHLRSFYNRITMLGEVYTPTYITQAEYDQIVTSPVEKGRQYKMQGKGKGKGHKQNSGNGSCKN